MAQEMSDKRKREHPQIRRSASSRTKVVCEAQYDARRSVKGIVGSAQLQAIVSNSLSGELLSNLEPIDGALEVNKLVGNRR